MIEVAKLRKGQMVPDHGAAELEAAEVQIARCLVVAFGSDEKLLMVGKEWFGADVVVNYSDKSGVAKVYAIMAEWKDEKVEGASRDPWMWMWVDELERIDVGAW